MKNKYRINDQVLVKKLVCIDGKNYFVEFDLPTEGIIESWEKGYYDAVVSVKSGRRFCVRFSHIQHIKKEKGCGTNKHPKDG